MGNYTCSIDLGTHLTKVIISRLESSYLENNLSFSSDPSPIEIIGVSTLPSAGIKSGSIMNIAAIAEVIQEALNEAELISGIEVEEALVNITGKHLYGENSCGVIAVSEPSKGIDLLDLIRSIEYSQNVRMPIDKEIIHVLSRHFNVDNEEKIKDPISMTGMRLEANVHLVSANLTAISNIHKSIESSGVKVTDMVMNSLASAEAILTTEQKELGAVVIDLGEGTADMIAYTEGGVSLSYVLPYGGGHITQDISIGLKTPTIEVAEMLKKNYGAALNRLIDPTEKIDLPQNYSKNKNWILRQNMAIIIEDRLREIFELLAAELKKTGIIENIGSGIMLCGGSSLLEGIDDLAEEVFSLPCFLPSPKPMRGFYDKVLSAEYTVALGMLYYKERLATKKRIPSTSSTKFVHRIKDWMIENF